jgi:FkbM family methyltransferase
MFRSSKNTAASKRLERAQELRQQRLKTKVIESGGSGFKAATASGSAAAPSDEEETLIISGACTVFCGFLIILIGAVMATAFFVVYQPECMEGVSFGAMVGGVHKKFSGTGNLPASDNLRKLAKTTSTATRAAAAAVFHPMPSHPAFAQDHSKFPPQCTTEELASVAHQLPRGGCETTQYKPWSRDKCSFSAATTCADPVWLREYHASTPLPAGERFVSIIQGCNKGDAALDMLHIGSKNSQFTVESWKDNFKEANAEDKVVDDRGTCPKKAVTLAGPEQPAKVYCIEALPNNLAALERTKFESHIGDDSLESMEFINLALSDKPSTVRVPTTDAIGVDSYFSTWKKACHKNNDKAACSDLKVDTMDHWIETQVKDLPKDAPIHHLSTNAEGHDYQVLVGAANTLSRVQYLDLQYHWYGDWGKRSLSDLMGRLKKKGFTCYFAGDNKLWRITDCWQDHYEFRFWSNIACVNTQLVGAEPLAQKMEAIFQETLKQDLQFGEA